MREATGRVVDIHVTGPLVAPRVDPEPLPDVWSRASTAVRRLADRDESNTTTSDRPPITPRDRRRSTPPGPAAPGYTPAPVPPLPAIPPARAPSPDAPPARAPSPRPSVLGRLLPGPRS